MSAALLSPQLQRSLPNLGGGIASVRTRRTRPRQCSAIAVDAPSPLAGGVAGVRWGSSSVQGPRSEMEDDVVLRSDGLDGFAFAAVFDGHAGFSSVEFLRGLPLQPSYTIKPGPYRSGFMNKSHESLGKYGFTNWDELYKECVEVLQGGLLLTSKNFDAIKAGIAKAFETVDTKLLTWLEQIGKDVDSGATATVMFLGKGVLIISHVGDSCVVISRTGKAEILTGPHRPYGNNRVSLEEVKRIRAAGGWIIDGRICGDISVSRAFGDIRFKTKKNEMLKKGVEEGRWTEKFISRIQFKDDLVISSPDIYQLDLGSDVEFILLASDGLWDYMKSSDAVTFVRNQLRQHGDVQLACDALAQATLDRKSQDNISIVIADLGRTDWQSVPPQGPNFFYEMSQAFATVGIVSLGIWISSFLLV